MVISRKRTKNIFGDGICFTQTTLLLNLFRLKIPIKIKPHLAQRLNLALGQNRASFNFRWLCEIREAYSVSLFLFRRGDVLGVGFVIPAEAGIHLQGAG